jgi:LL-diaminopimelate aminotransferase
MSPAKRLDNVPEYIFARLAKKVTEVEAKSGRKVLSFGAGTPDIKPSSKYMSKLVEFIQEESAHHYPGYGATAELSDAMIIWYESRFNVSLEIKEFLPLLGAKDGISHLPLALLNEGDEVLVPNPGYPAFTGPTLLAGGVPVFYDLTAVNDFRINYDELGKKVSSRTKYIWVNFPSNPTGQIADINELQKVIDFARTHNILVVYDNAYSEITFSDFVAPSILQINGAKEIAVEIGSFSKSFSFAGFRIGWIVGNAKVIAALSKVKSQIDSGLSLPLQKLGAYTLSNQDKDWHVSMIANYKSRRNVIASNMHRLGLQFELPKGALYIWAKIPDQSITSEEFCIDLLEQKQILVTPGTAFGTTGEGYVRISICVNIDNISEYFS